MDPKSLKRFMADKPVEVSLPCVDFNNLNVAMLYVVLHAIVAEPYHPGRLGRGVKTVRHFDDQCKSPPPRKKLRKQSRQY